VGGGIRTETTAAAVEAGGGQGEPEHRGAGGSALITAIAALRRQASSSRSTRRESPTATLSVYARSGKTAAARRRQRPRGEERGAGEILLTSIDRDGTKAGFDCALTAAVSSAVSIPVIASGGAGSLDDFVDVFTTGRADAALAASIFHYAETSVRGLKTYLKQRGIPVRL
jgi:cyclase